MNGVDGQCYYIMRLWLYGGREVSPGSAFTIGGYMDGQMDMETPPPPLFLPLIKLQCNRVRVKRQACVVL